MTKRQGYRIVQRAQFTDPAKPIFEVQKRVCFWWDHAGLFESLAEAELRVFQLKVADENPIKTKTVKVFY